MDPRLCREHFIQTWQCLVYCAQFAETPPEPEPVLPPSSSDRRSLILDLDETLIHCNESPDAACDVRLDIVFDSGQVLRAGINFRPFVFEFLEKMSKVYEVVVFTASQQVYADKILDLLDPSRTRITHRLYREHCWVSEGTVHVKDLRRLNRPLSKMILVDNSAYSFGLQIDNGVPILPYYQGQDDLELQHLCSFLLMISQYQYRRMDVRQVLRETFHLSEMIQMDDFWAIYHTYIAKKL